MVHQNQSTGKHLIATRPHRHDHFNAPHLNQCARSSGRTSTSIGWQIKTDLAQCPFVLFFLTHISYLSTSLRSLIYALTMLPPSGHTGNCGVPWSSWQHVLHLPATLGFKLWKTVKCIFTVYVYLSIRPASYYDRTIYQTGLRQIFRNRYR